MSVLSENSAIWQLLPGLSSSGVSAHSILFSDSIPVVLCREEKPLWQSPAQSLSPSCCSCFLARELITARPLYSFPSHSGANLPSPIKYLLCLLLVEAVF